jgi:hypothetical protein
MNINNFLFETEEMKTKTSEAGGRTLTLFLAVHMMGHFVKECFKKSLWNEG